MNFANSRLSRDTFKAKENTSTTLLPSFYSDTSIDIKFYFFKFICNMKALDATISRFFVKIWLEKNETTK